MKNIIQSSVSRGFCIGCGVCQTVCSVNAIRMVYTKEKEYKPVLDIDKCVECGACEVYCPNSYEKKCKDIATLKESNDKIAYGMDKAVGYFWCKEREDKKLLKSASGGFVTAFVGFLLKEKIIDCVVHGKRRAAKTGEEHYESAVSWCVEQLEEGRSSIYGPVCFNDIINQFRDQSYRIMVIGTPCVINAFKKLFLEHHAYKNNKIYSIALCCSHNVSGLFSDFIADNYMVSRDVEYIVNFRVKKREMLDPNNYYINLYRDSTKEDIIKEPRNNTCFTPIWRNYFFASEACEFCCDFWGKEADISTKDSWGKLGAASRYGSSIVIFRNRELMRYFLQMRDLDIKKISFKDARNCQVPSVKYKQIDILERFDKDVSEMEQSAEYLKHKLYMEKSKSLYLQHGYQRVKEELVDKVMEEFQKESSGKPENKIKGYIKYFARMIKLNKVKAFLWPTYRSMKQLIRYQKKKYNKVIMLGTFNQINAGDEAQIDSTIKIMQERYPEYLVKVLTHVPHYTYNHHYHCVVGPNPRECIWDHDENPDKYYNVTKWYHKFRFLFKAYWTCFNAYLVRADLPTFFLNAKKASLLQDIKTSDLLYFSGGGAMTGATLTRCWDFMFSMKIARIFKVPYVMSGQNSGLWNSKYTERLVSANLKHARAITLRDPYAIDNLKKIGVYGEHVFTMFDDALFCDKCEDVEQYLYDFGIDSDEYVALNLHYWGIEESKDEQRVLLERLKNICDYITEKTKLKILLVPMASVDEQPMEDFIYACDNSNVKVARFAEYDFRILRGLIAKARYCITMKHHPIIFALGEGVPTISMAYKPYYLYKNKGALKIFELEKYTFDLEKTTYFEDFQCLFDEIVEKHENISNYLIEHLESLRERREKLLCIVDDLLK